MPNITLEDLCLIDTNEIRDVSEFYLTEDPECPEDALLRSGAVYDPLDDDFTGLADGNYTAADFKFYDEGGMFDDPAAGLGCPTDCNTLEQIIERANQISWNACIQEDALLGFCKGSDPTADPFEVLARNETRVRAVRNQYYIMAQLAGIGNTIAAQEAAGVDTMLYCNFATNNVDGTALSVANMAGATADLSVTPDYYLATKGTVRALRAQGFQPFCCTDDGQVRNSITDLVTPDGQRIIQVDGKFNRFLDPNGDGSVLRMIGLQDRSIAWRRTTENDTSDILRGFNPFFFDQPSKCDPVKAIQNERAAMHMRGFTYTGPIERCTNPLSLADLINGNHFAYSSTPDQYEGFDKSGIVILEGAPANGGKA